MRNTPGVVGGEGNVTALESQVRTGLAGAEYWHKAAIRVLDRPRTSDATLAPIENDAGILAKVTGWERMRVVFKVPDAGIAKFLTPLSKGVAVDVPSRLNEFKLMATVCADALVSVISTEVAPQVNGVAESKLIEMRHGVDKLTGLLKSKRYLPSALYI